MPRKKQISWQASRSAPNICCWACCGKKIQMCCRPWQRQESMFTRQGIASCRNTIWLFWSASRNTNRLSEKRCCDSSAFALLILVLLLIYVIVRLVTRSGLRAHSPAAHLPWINTLKLPFAVIAHPDSTKPRVNRIGLRIIAILIDHFVRRRINPRHRISVHRYPYISSAIADFTAFAGNTAQGLPPPPCSVAGSMRETSPSD